ncbi:efflux RND transporter permease subunit [Methylomonas sp. SURF-2]|uniref:Efflux RND transporter permease subunit n=1 Tax=Methylomonas subterranea TaxID=2952225 RepID=A0ABT1TL65_9GAMM|nr:efflux RND transporter permease subunit [Methylomonas sp. SURF-2]MCQ8106214.1 efflux RND transporter permease subunit [Methylomonas sp. SURF-2]
MWIVQIALRRPYTFVVAALLIILSAPYVLRKMPTDIFPTIDIPVVAMLWQYNGMNAQEIADRLTSSVERSMNLIDGIEHSESLSYAGASVIKVFFHPGTDIRTAIAQVMASSNSVYRSLPTNVTPPQVIQYSASDLPLVQLGISSSIVPETDVNDYTNNIVRSTLQAKRGVAQTNPFGSKSRQITVDVDPMALLARGLAPSDLSDALGAQNLILPTGTIKIGSNEYDVTLNGAVASIPRLGDIPVKSANGVTTLIGDVALVRDGAAPQTTIARQNGERGILTSIFKIGRISTLEVVDHVKEAIPKMLEKMPEGINMRLMFDQSLFVKAAIGNVLHEGLIAAGLTAAMILLFLGNWRTTCIIAVSIPLAILCSLLLLYLLGETINLMTMGGLALAIGILVDDATVEIENIERQMLLGKKPQQAILDGAAEIAMPAFVSTLCICIVFLPMFFLAGVARSLFVPMAEAVVFAMLASYLLSRTLVPTLVMYVMAGHHGKLQTPSRNGRGRGLHDLHLAFERAFERFRGHYVVLTSHLLKHKLRYASLMLGFCLLSLGLVPLLGQDLFPAVDAGQIRLHVRAPSGTRIEEMPKKIDEVEALIRERIPAGELEDMLDIIGGPYSTRNTLFGNSGTVESADTEIMISLRAERHAPSADYIKTLRAELPHRFPDLEFFFQPADQISQTLNFGVPAPIDIQFIGGKPGDVLPHVQAFQNRIRQIPGIVDAHIYQRISRPALQLDMNRRQLQQHGLSARDLAQNLLLTLSGSMQTAPSYWLNPANGNTVNVGVMANPLYLDSLDALLRTPVGGAGGAAPQLLGNLVTVTRGVTPAAVTHYNTDNVFNVYASVEGRDLGSVSRELDRLVAEMQPALPRGVELAVRGQIETLRGSFDGLSSGLAVAIVLLYLLLVINFQSWLDPLIIVSALPAALAGIAWTLFLTGTTLSIPALTGSIMAMGVVTANSILLVSFARGRLSEGVTPAIAALEAASTRLRPVLMTAFAMIVGMLPMALGWGEGAEQNAPLGRAVIGGLAFATVSTLLFVPLVFAGAHRWLEHRRSHGVFLVTE